MTEMTMTGYDRTYQPPRSLRRAAAEQEAPDRLTSRIASGRCEAWDLLQLQEREDAGTWATSTVTSLIASIEEEARDVLDCTDCEDTGFYGLPASGNVDLLDGLLRRVGDGEYESLQADGIWETWEGTPDQAEILSLDLASDLAAALTAGASGLLRKYCWPVAFLPPSGVVAAGPLVDLIGPDAAVTPQGEWVNFAIVDDDDPGAVMAVVRASAGDDLEIWQDGKWEPWALLESDLQAVPIDDSLCQELIASGALVADAPLTVSPDPRAEKLRRYWSTGKGAAKIRWMTPGDWKRCYRHLKKYMGPLAKGYCQNLHKRNDGVWTGSRLNPGGNGHRHRGLLSSALETQLVAALESGQWTGEPERTTDMPLADGIYCEVDDNVGIMQTITAGGFPVAPPDEWYQDPGFSGPTPMQVDDDGRVHGHIATFDVTHIGMAGAVHAPRSKSGYAYFMTGALKTASGKQVNVGQLTLSGGHAPLHADAGAAVKHYDDTNSAVADVTVGEDAYGIWAAGSLRPNITPEQVRTFRASPLSGDWRPINGNLELVAACAVNVPGFPTARARVAGGAILALVAAGAGPLAQRKAAMTADAVLLERLDALEARIPAVQEPEPAPTPEPIPAPAPAPAPEPVPEPEPVKAVEPVAASTAIAEAPALKEQVEEAVAAAEKETPEEVQPEAADKLDPEQIKQAREDAKAIRRDWLRRQVHDAGVTAGAIPPQFLKNAAKKSSKTIPETERKGGGYPIKDAASLKDAIQAFGRSKPADRAKTKAHIISAAKQLGLTKMLPEGW